MGYKVLETTEFDRILNDLVIGQKVTEFRKSFLPGSEVTQNLELIFESGGALKIDARRAGDFAVLVLGGKKGVVGAPCAYVH